VQNINSIGEIFSGNRSYSKGSSVLHMLRGVVGDESFFNILKAYSSDPEVAYDVAETSDFQRVCETITGMDLDYFFEEWIYGENYPKYTYTWGFSENEDGTYSVNLNLSQIKNSNPKFFIMPIDIKIYYQNGDSTFTVFNNLNIQEFSFLLNSRPHKLEFDPNNKILKEIISFSTSVKNEYFINEFKLGQNYPNPFNPITKINYSVPQGINFELSYQNVILKGYDVLGREITTLVNEAKQPGNYEVIFNATNLSTGIYYYKLSSGNFVETKKMVVLK
jgi:aminopeptidase N